MARIVLSSKAYSPAASFADWLARKPCPPDEPGAPMINAWIKGAANVCKLKGVDQSDAVDLIRAAMTRREKTPTEVSRTVARSYESEIVGRPADKPVGDPVQPYSIDLLTDRASKCPIEITDDWLAERSPECVLDAGPDYFLRHVYQHDEQVAIVVGENHSNGDTKWRRMETLWSHDGSPDKLDYLRQGFRYQAAGIWFCCNPVEPWSSSWSESNIQSWQHGILESDAAPPDLWLRAVVQLHLPIVAIYTSGGRSIHVLYRIDATSKQNWDALADPIKRKMVPLGACIRAMTAVRLTRLPGCWRGEKQGQQRLLYLDPCADGSPIFTP